MVDRARVGRSFDRGSEQYDAHTPVQQRVVTELLARLQQRLALQPLRILDIGCGTGRLLEQVSTLWPSTELYGLDLAEGMLQQANERLGGRAVLTHADAERLPFADGYFDLVVSSSTFQWLEQLEGCFGEVHRVLAPGGRFEFSLFGAGTLYELQQSWREALDHCKRLLEETRDGTHRFHDSGQVAMALQQQGFAGVEVIGMAETVWYDDLPKLLRAIKRVGAGSARPPAGGGLGWRTVLHAMAACYTRRFASSAGLPATYQVLYGSGARR